MLSKSEIVSYIEDYDSQALFTSARKEAEFYCGKNVFIRGILEFSNYCVNNCLYCGLRQDNSEIERVRLSLNDIARSACEMINLAFKTIVRQPGDDYFYSVSDICDMISRIKEFDPDCAVTLSVGERGFSDYKAFREAGADRYLIKHETASKVLYEKFHPNQSFEERRKILFKLREIGFQIGTGFIVGLSGQVIDDLVEDILFIQELQPDMVGLGPFISQSNTPLSDAACGSIELTLKMIALTRLVTKNAHIPATTALASLDPDNGLSDGLRAGANVIMCDYSPENFRKKYCIYDKKSHITLEIAEKHISRVGLKMNMSRGDSLKL